MKVIKRNGTEVDFDKNKIVVAIRKAKLDTPTSRLGDSLICEIADYIEYKCSKYDRSVDIEEIQDMVENGIMSKGEFELARNYIRYRYQRTIDRGSKTFDERIMNLIDNKNEELTQENANKNPTINATQRDYMAGEVSKELCKKYLFSDEVMQAHKDGIIHIHDMDYSIMKDFNCCLVNLEDMLQNGTVITKTMIEKPHSFSTACNVATQIIAQVASNQYGGQTITLSHLAPFVDISRKKIAKEVEKELEGMDVPRKRKNEIVESRVKKEITRGVQTIQYQILTLMTTNGQTPFVSVAMYLGECKTKRLKKDLAMIIEEVLKQRIQGIKNEKGAWITPVFPKLLYILEEDNIHEDSPYWYLTELAAKCTAKRMVPDYISEKVMKELKNGQAFPCMGAVDGKEVITYELDGKLRTESFERAWDRVSKFYNNTIQYSPVSLFIPTPGLFILDKSSNGFVEVKKFTRNNDMGRWYRLNISGDRSILLTEDHPLPTQRGRIHASELVPGDRIPNSTKYFEETSIEYCEVISIEFLGHRDRYEYDVETESDRFDVSGINSHNCRSFLSDYVDPKTGKHKFYGRFNLGVVTLNLVDVALSSGKDKKKFWKIMEERSKLVFDAHMARINYLKGTKSDVSPIHWQHGAIARLKSGETIDKLFYNGYSTVSYGYAGLYECVKYMTGKSHTDPKAKPFAKKVLQFINDKCNQWKEETKLGFSVYGSPIESVTYKFAKCLQKRFGKVEGICDRNYITNSFHVNVREEIDIFSKLKFEAEFQSLSTAGCISYGEIPDMGKNIPALLKVIQYIYDNTMYAELNSKSDYCMNCGYDGEIEMKKDKTGKLYWECPNCGNKDLNKMTIVRRVCGYLSSNTANQGRMADIHDRVMHL